MSTRTEVAVPFPGSMDTVWTLYDSSLTFSPCLRASFALQLIYHSIRNLTFIHLAITL
ncbi:MAG: hypothetical protein ACK41Q_01540 [Candidatus Brocadia sp.]